jgi:uncharacterized protein (PEP-CTERM system associated)
MRKTPEVSRPCPSASWPLLGLLALAAGQAQAQEERAPTSSTRTFTVSSGMSVQATLTDNLNLSATNRRSELITTVSPNLSVRSDAGRVQGSLNYSLNGLIYARGSSANTIQHALSANVKSELVDNFAFVDANASVSQQNIFALGPLSPDSRLRSGNQTQVATLTVSPYVRGRLGGFATYDARLSYSTTDTDADSIGGSSSGSASLRVGSDASFARLSWAVTASHQVSDFSAGRRTATDQVVGSLGYAATPQLQFSARAGRETSDLLTSQGEGHTTYGLGAAWRPSPRTSLSIDADSHFYGNSHSVNFSYRTPRTAWTISDTRSTSTGASPLQGGLPLNQFDILYLSLTSRYPDPGERTRQTLRELQSLGIDPFAVAQRGFLTSAVSLQRSQQMSMAYLGLRTNFTLSAFQSWSSRLDALSPAVDSLSGGAQVRQRGFSAAASHRLTPQSSLTLNATLTRTSGQEFRSLTASWANAIGLRTSVSLAARHSTADSATNPYRESALIANLSHQF